MVEERHEGEVALVDEVEVEIEAQLFVEFKNNIGDL
jgi:hypothetical protein